MSTIAFKSVADGNPMAAALPIVFTPHPVIGVSPETLDKYIIGEDPVTHKTIIDEIIDVLTRPQQAKQTAAPNSHPISAATAPLYLKPDTEDNLHDLFYKNGWTDGLPVILPTEARVQKMMTGTCAGPDNIAAEGFNFDTHEMLKYTVRNIATIAVMAGATPEMFPVILAVAATRQSALMPSTTPFEAMLLVNGPIRNEIGMNCGIGAFSAVNRANSVLGRAWTLMSVTHGFARVRNTLWSSQGNNHTYNNMCAGENEERSVWEPFHVTKGFNASESVISIFRGWTFMNSTGAASHRSLTEELNIELAVMPPMNSSATIIMDPMVARELKDDEGFATKLDFAKHLSKNIKMPNGQFWKTDYIDMLVASEAYKGVEPYAGWKKLPDDAMIYPYHKPENINIIVIGGETSPLWKAADYGYSGSQPVDKWRAKPAGAVCKDGECGLPDEQVEYDK